MRLVLGLGKVVVASLALRACAGVVVEIGFKEGFVRVLFGINYFLIKFF